MQLTKKQRNDVFHAIVNGTLDPATCEMEPTSNGFAIVHLPTNSRFETRPETRGGFTYRISYKVRTDPLSAGSLTAWGQVLDVMTNWAKGVAEWEEVPDLWAMRHDLKSFVLADVITPDIFQHILMMMFHGLEHLFIGGGLSPRRALGE